MNMQKRWWVALYGCIAATILIVDQITKRYALTWCARKVTFNSFFSCELVFNRGISWGMFYANTPLLFWTATAMVAGITAAVLWSARYQFAKSNNVLAETFIVAGSCSNLIDRFWWQGVIDFIGLSWGNWHYPLFNVADIFIVLGVGLLMIRFYRE